MEIWKDIPGFEGYYQVSSIGRVKRIKNRVFRKATRRNRATYLWRQEKILSQHLTHKGYLRTCFTVNGREKTVQVHRLVGLAFILPVKGKTEINHKNGIKNDNRVENLEWCNHDENVKHSVNLGTYQRGEKNGQSKLTEKQVLEIRKYYKPGYGNCNVTVLAKRYDVTLGLIGHIIRRKSWKHI